MSDIGIMQIAVFLASVLAIAAGLASVSLVLIVIAKTLMSKDSRLIADDHFVYKDQGSKSGRGMTGLFDP